MEFQLPLRVYIEDTDAGGIVYYVNYLKYMERARTELMRSLEIAKAAILDDALLFVVSDIQVKYRRSAKLDDSLIATAKLCELGRVKMCFEQKIFRGDELLCEGLVDIACVDKQALKPRRIPAQVLEKLGAV